LGTRWIRFCANHECGFFSARLLTAVRLAHRHHVQVGLARIVQQADPLAHVVDVVVEVERPGAEGHHARVDPVAHPDVVFGEQRAHGIAQQRGVVARERCHHQDLFCPGMLGFEVHQLAERQVERDFHARLGDAPLGLFVAAGEPQEQIARGGDALGERQVDEGTERVVEPASRQLRHEAPWRKRHVLRFVQAIKHSRKPPAGSM
jgi:hypothetical protein